MDGAEAGNDTASRECRPEPLPSSASVLSERVKADHPFSDQRLEAMTSMPYMDLE